MLNSSRWRRAAMSLVPLIWVSVLVATPAATAQSPRSSKEVSFEDQFWKYLVGNNYKNWSPGPSDSAGFYKGQNPHGAYLKMYINRTAAGSIDDLTVGSVIILENYLEDQSLKTISVMYRTSGFNPSGNDWYWIEYKPDGSVVRSAARDTQTGNRIKNVGLTMSPQKLSVGKASNCIQCHQSAAGSDFVFSNDRFEQPVKTVAMKEASDAKLKEALDEVLEEPSEENSEEFDYIADADADEFFGSR